MKIQHLTVFLLAILTISSQAQIKNVVFDVKTKVTWLGLDFTDAIFIGDRERLGSKEDINHLLGGLNRLIVDEPYKFDIALAIDKKKVENAIEVTLEKNETLDVLEKYASSSKEYFHIKPNRINEIVDTYSFKDLEGVGLMFIIESFNKINEEASIWVTFIDMNTKEIIISERITAEPKGFGLRNYWAGAIYSVIQKVKKKEFEMWRRKHFRA